MPKKTKKLAKESVTLTLTPNQFESLSAALQCLFEDCEMALCGDWDKSDEGFECTRDTVVEVADLLGVTLDNYIPESQRG